MNSLEMTFEDELIEIKYFRAEYVWQSIIAFGGCHINLMFKI